MTSPGTLVAAGILAHEPVAPGGLWTAWVPQPSVLVGLVLAGLAYANGARAARDRPALAPVLRRRRRAALGAGAALVLALASPLDAAAGAVFSAHMVQHLLLSGVAAPLLVLAAPVRTIRRGLSPRWRRALDRWWQPLPGDAPLRRWATVPATLVSLGVLSVWHVPWLYDAALASDLVHGLEHVTILAAGTLYWWAVISAARRHQVLWAVGALAVACIHGGALGALLALSAEPWYRLHAEGARAWGVAPLADQQVAGAVMWVPAAAVYLAAMALVLHRWFARAEPASTAQAPVSPPPRRAGAGASAAP